jgi:hypothetical protein
MLRALHVQCQLVQLYSLQRTFLYTFSDRQVGEMWDVSRNVTEMRPRGGVLWHSRNTGKGKVKFRKLRRSF